MITAKLCGNENNPSELLTVKAGCIEMANEPWRLIQGKRGQFWLEIYWDFHCDRCCFGPHRHCQTPYLIPYNQTPDFSVFIFSVADGEYAAT